MRLRFVNPKTGEEGTAFAFGEDVPSYLAMDADGRVIEVGYSGTWAEPRPDLRAEIVPDWIPVEERLPEPHTECLIRIDGTFAGGPLVWIEQAMWSHNAEAWVMTHRHDEPFAITHWMPLPSAEVDR